MKKLSRYLIFGILILYLIFPLRNLTYGVENDTISIDSKLYSDCLLLIERETGDILYERNAYERRYPASTTKMLTAIIVLEECNLNELVTVSASAINAVPAGYTTANLKEGEQFRVEDLLYALLIPSANDAANVLAEHVSGSISAFADRMNAKATEIGLEHSHFTNPSGIHNESLYTTAYDLSIIAKYAMNIEKFREITQTTSFTLPKTSIHPEEDRTFTTSNLLLVPSETSYYYEYATGLKTGFTSPAGDCLVASAKKDDIEFIVVCLHSSSLKNGLREKFLDCKTLFEFAFDNYTTHYKNLQEENTNNNPEILEPLIEDISDKDGNNSSFLRLLLKIITVLIILFSIKILFFRKKKNKRKKLKNKKR